jgi:hypothetical protein
MLARRYIHMTVKRCNVGRIPARWRSVFSSARPSFKFNGTNPFYIHGGAPFTHPDKTGSNLHFRQRRPRLAAKHAGQIRDQLPAGTVVAHKTGTGGTRNGITSATNDIGIITLPDGRHLAMAAFVSDSTADDATREAVIARLAKAAWDRAQSLGR